MTGDGERPLTWWIVQCGCGCSINAPELRLVREAFAMHAATCGEATPETEGEAPLPPRNRRALARALRQTMAAAADALPLLDDDEAPVVAQGGEAA